MRASERPSGGRRRGSRDLDEPRVAHSQPPVAIVAAATAAAAASWLEVHEDFVGHSRAQTRVDPDARALAHRGAAVHESRAIVDDEEWLRL